MWLGHNAIGHPVLFVFVAALIVRVTLAIVLSATVGMDPFSDAKVFGGLASDLASGASRHWSDSNELFYERLAGYVLPLGALYWVFGDHLFFGQLLAALFGAVAAAAVCGLTLLAANRRAALTAGFIVALFPSHVLWSSIPYRDSAVWAAAAVAALLVAVGARARGWRLAAVGAGVAALVFVLGHLRLTTTVAVCGALVAASLFSDRRGRAIRVAGALVIAALVPWYLGIGPGGADLVRPLGGVRGALACQAQSAVTKCNPDSSVSREGSREGDSLIPSEASISRDVRHFPRGLSVMLLEPFPWASLGGFQLRLAQLELLLWLPLIALAAVGLSAAYRRRRELSFLVLTAGAVLIVYALGEGNLGTAYRHRSELVPALAVLAALGAPRIVRSWRGRQAAPEPQGCGDLPA
jgi:4-amino-4-deoxy-L-arabinose transferase-like glycosyltransferase